MGRTVLLAAFGLLALSGTLAADKKVNSSVTQDQVADNDSSVKRDREVAGLDRLVKREQGDADHVFAESAPRLYRKVAEPRVYASSAPHTSYSYKVFAGPHTAGSKNIPVKTSSVVAPKALHFDVRDSYGKYVQNNQFSGYKPSFPQQFVRLQDLPPHLAQPLVSAASPSFQFRSVPNYFFGPQSYQVPELQLSGTSNNQFGRFSEPLVYAEDIRNLAPQTILQLPSVLHQTTANLQDTQDSPKYQRLQEEPKKSAYKSNKKNNIRYRPQDVQYHSSQELALHLQETAPTNVPAVVNGKKTYVKVETKPVLPLLDLNLLEPLQFDKPFVTQIQHFLPKIPQATYNKLPTFNPKKDQNDYTVTKTKTHDPSPKKKHKKQPQPEIILEEDPDEEDCSYEIHTPNGKETYSEKVLRYNKETNHPPVQVSYNVQSQKEPTVYSFMHSSKQPLKVTHVEYNSDDDEPKQSEYVSQDQEQDGERDDSGRPSSQESSDDSGEYSAESEEEGAAAQTHSEESPQNQQHHHKKENLESPNYSQEQNDEQNRHRESSKEQSVTYLLPTQQYQAKAGHQGQGQNYSPKPQYYIKTQSPPPQQNQFYIKTQASPPPKQHNNNQNSPNQYQNLNYEINHVGSTTPRQQQHNSNQNSPNQYQNLNYEINHVGSTTPRQHQHNINQNSPNQYQNLNYEINHVGSTTPRQHGEIPSHQLKVEHRGQHDQQKPNYGIQQQIIQTTPQYFSQPIIVQSSFQPMTTETLRIVPTRLPHAAPIRVDPNQHVQLRPTQQSYITHSSPAPQKSAPQQFNTPTFKPIPPSNPGPNVYGKAQRVHIKQKEETPDEKHMHTEQIMAEMIDQMENSEEDFEKAYKEAAFGFPAYKQIEEDVEKEVYNPDSYGVPQSDYGFDDKVFQEYQDQGDKFPKAARLTYKTIKDNNQEDYYSNYAIHKPESFADRVKNKVEYFKMFKKHSPHKSNEMKSEKLLISPSFDNLEESPLERKRAKQNKPLAEYKLAPKVKYEYQYDYEPPKDSSAYASRPYHKKYRTHFAEPKFQYGFEPLVYAPIAAESEMSAVATSLNRSPESEKPGTRKKLYKEKWYIKKTTTRNKAS